MRKPFFIVMICIGVTALLFIDQWQVSQWQSKKKEELASTLALCKTQLKNSIKNRFGAVESLASLFFIHPDTTPDEFSSFASLVLGFHGPVRALQFADASTRVKYVFPAKDNEITIDSPMTLLEDEKRGHFTRKAIQEKMGVLQGPFSLRQGGKGIILRFPIFKDRQLLGLAIGVYDLPVLITEALQGLNLAGISLQLADHGGKVFYRSGPSVLPVQKRIFSIADKNWTVSAAWKNPPSPPLNTRMLIWLFGLGFLLSALLSLRFFWKEERRLEALVENRTRELSAANASLQENEQQVKAILEANPDPVVVYDTDGHPTYLNPAFTEVFGWSLEEVSHRTIPFVPESQKETAALRIEEVYQSGRPINFLTQRLTKANHTVDVLVSAATVKDPGGKGRGLVVNLTDITEQKRMEAQLQQAQKMESIGLLAGGIAHDFNNMLTIILGNTEIILQDLAADSPMVKNIKEIQKAAQRSGSLTRQLLAFARKQTVSPEKIDLNMAVEKTLKMLQRLIGEDIELAWLPGKEPALITMDPSQVDQVLANLCVNARDAITDVGKITIETDIVTLDSSDCQGHPDATSGEYVMVAVSDTGCGMDKVIQKKIFDPFFTTKEMGQGTGLGLSMVYGIVRQNNGVIAVYSEPDRGTCFKLYLPRSAGNREMPTAPYEMPHLPRGEETILVVEDEEAILKMTAMMLERQGYTVLSASRPLDAIAVADSFSGRIDLLMTDVVMPGMNGQNLAEKLTELSPDLKTLFMSGYTANVIAHHGVLDEGVQFIQKPFSRQNLAVKIRNVLDGSPGGA